MSLPVFPADGRAVVQNEVAVKKHEYSCHSERSAASLRISPPLKERFFAALRMTSPGLKSLWWHRYLTGASTQVENLCHPTAAGTETRPST
jgi:hypothetical protein